MDAAAVWQPQLFIKVRGKELHYTSISVTQSLKAPDRFNPFLHHCHTHSVCCRLRYFYLFLLLCLNFLWTVTLFLLSMWPTCVLCVSSSCKQQITLFELEAVTNTDRAACCFSPQRRQMLEVIDLWTLTQYCQLLLDTLNSDTKMEENFHRVDLCWLLVEFWTTDFCCFYWN